LMIVGLDATGMDPDVAYVVALWFPVLASAAVAELTSPASKLRASTLAPVAERISP
jgi:hypothetical protein